MAGIAAQGPANSLSGVHWHPRGDFKLSDCDCDCDRDFNDTANTMSRGGFIRMAAVVQRSPEAYRKLVLLGLQRGFAINASAMELNNDGAVRAGYRGTVVLLKWSGKTPCFDLLGNATSPYQGMVPSRLAQVRKTACEGERTRRERADSSPRDSAVEDIGSAPILLIMSSKCVTGWLTRTLRFLRRNTPDSKYMYIVNCIRTQCRAWNRTSVTRRGAHAS